MRGYLFVAHIDDIYTFVNTSVVDIDNVAAGNRENVPDAFLLQHFGDDLAARNHFRSGDGLGVIGVSDSGSHVDLVL